MTDRSGSNERLVSDPRNDACATEGPETEDLLQSLTVPTCDNGASSQLSSQLDGLKPPRGYSWEPFKVGNTVALRHGATSPRAIAERAELVHAHLLEVCPWLDEARYAPALQRYLAATAREQLAHEAYMAEPTKARLLEAATASARLAWSIGAELGLTPAGHARLRILTAGGEHAEASLHDLAAEGRAVRERAEARREDALAPVVELGGTGDQEGDGNG